MLAAFAAYVIIGQPAWVVDPLSEAVSGVLLGMGVGLLLLLALVAWLGWLLAHKGRALLQQWRNLVGVGFLTAGVFAFLSYFQADFPVAGAAPLGGELGAAIRGPYGVQGVLRTAGLLAIGGWLIAPVPFNLAALWTGRGARTVGRGISNGVHRVNPRERQALLRDVNTHLGTNSDGTSREAYISALRAADAYQRAAAPRGLAYLAPTSPQAATPRSPEPPPKAAQPRPWPGLRSSDADSPPPAVVAPAAVAAAPSPSVIAAAASAGAATATIAPPADPSPATEAADPEPAAPACETERAAAEAPVADAAYVGDALQSDIEEAMSHAVDTEHAAPAETVPPITPAPEAAPPPVVPMPARAEPSLLPPLALLAAPVAAGSITEEHLVTAALIEETLAQHGVEVSVSEIRPGPSVTMFGLVPGWNRKAMSARARALAAQEESQVQAEVRNRVKVDSILAREKDLALALAAPTLRIQAPVPGEPLVGVEMPNKSSSMVTIRTVIESQAYEEVLAGGGLPVALGLASAGEPVVLDLLKMPHLLIAGATGSGKSVCINTIISSVICHQDPAKVRMLLVDPKRVELTPYNGIPHLVTPVVVDPDKVVRLLKGAIQEMMRRYKLLEEAGVRNIVSYNRSPRAVEEMPYFVICIDELADLMMTASFDVEQSLCRLAQLGRATGIHLIVATQRPSVDVITGLIKANFPSRIAFAVASQVDSRTILDAAGAERLLGRGDMLYISSDSPKPRRVQGVFISEDETAAISDHWRQLPLSASLPDISLESMAREADTAAAESAADGSEGDEGDSLYERALQVAAANRHLSTSLLQRRLRIGYPRAARLMDQLEDEGIVASSGEPGKPREVIYLPDEE